MRFTHLKTFELEEILPRLKKFKKDSTGDKCMKVKVDGKTYNVRLSSTKLRTFKRSQECVSCGIKGNIFIMDRQEGHKKVCINNNIHSNIVLNLYCHNPENGQTYILMTQDHIIPKSYGIGSSDANLQTMCEKCNREKKNTITPEDIKKLCSTKAGRKLLKKQYMHSGKTLVVTRE